MLNTYNEYSLITYNRLVRKSSKVVVVLQTVDDVVELESLIAILYDHSADEMVAKVYLR